MGKNQTNTKQEKITRDQYLMGRDKIAPLNNILEDNLKRLLQAVNAVLQNYPGAIIVSSGYRPATINQAVGGALASAHQTCEAVDIQDNNRELAKWLIKNQSLLVKYGLYMEHPGWTPTWVHLQIRAPKSGSRIFIPNASAPLDPSFIV